MHNESPSLYSKPAKSEHPKEVIEATDKSVTNKESFVPTNWESELQVNVAPVLASYTENSPPKMVKFSVRVFNSR